jgi:hypothetical protein
MIREGIGEWVAATKGGSGPGWGAAGGVAEGTGTSNVDEGSSEKVWYIGGALGSALKKLGADVW